MQQLSSLDAQFLALETDRNYGHVGSLAILDPSTTPAGKVTIEDVKRLLDERLHMIPPFTSRLAKVPLGLDWPYWVPDDHFDLGYHCRELALPAAGEHGAARRADRADLLAAPGPLAPAVGALPDPRPEGGRVALVTKIHHAAVDGMSGGEILTHALRPHARSPARSSRRRPSARRPAPRRRHAR